MALVALFACLIYANTLPNELVFDDRELILNQKAIRNPWDLEAILRGRYWDDLREDTLYRPLTIWSLALNYRVNLAIGLPGAHPVGFHLVNILAHALVGSLFYLFLLRVGMPAWGCVVAALLFAAHPIHTEAVASVVNRSEPLAALWGLAFLIFHRQGRWKGAAPVCYLLAMVSKESAAAFLPLAVWMDFCLRREERRFPLVSYGVYGLVLSGWLMMRFWAVSGISQAVPALDNPLVRAPLWDRILTAAGVQFDYLRLLAAPVGLSSDYSFNQVAVVSSALDGRVLGFLGVVTVALVLAWALRKRHPLVPLAVVGYAILFSPTSNFLLPIGTVMGERLAYAPSVFVCVLMGYGMWTLCRWRRGIALAVLGVVLAGYSALTFGRNRTWANERGFFSAQVRSAPNSAKANLGLGRYYHSIGEVDSAAALYDRALEIWPDYADAWNNLGVAYKDRGDLQSAIRAYRQAIAHHPKHARAHFNLGQAHQLLGDRRRAADAYKTAIQLDSDYAEAYCNLGTIYAESGRLEEAGVLWKRALALRPDYAIARTNLERLQGRAPGDATEAR